MLGQIPFLQNCEDEDSDEDDELDSVQHKKQRVKVSPSSTPCTAWAGCDLIEALLSQPGPSGAAVCAGSRDMETHRPWPGGACGQQRPCK